MTNTFRFWTIGTLIDVFKKTPGLGDELNHSSFKIKI